MAVKGTKSNGHVIIKGSMELPASKSESNRALIIRALCSKTFKITNLSEAEDTRILESLLNSKAEILDAGHGGTTYRFLTAYLSITPGTRILTGSDRQKERPVGELVEALRTVGANIKYLENEGFPPLKITGSKLEGGVISIHPGISSQFISALLMIAPKLSNGLKMELQGKVISRDYILMTMAMMRHFGIEAQWNGHIITVKNQDYRPADVVIEPDWSAASYWYEMAAFAGEAEIFFPDLQEQSLQGDRVIAAIYRHFGVESKFEEGGLRIKKQKRDKIASFQFQYDCTDCPDLAQTLAVTCAGLNVSARLTGLESLRIKETDRLEALKTELQKFGKNVEIKGDNELIISGTPELKSPPVPIRTYLDHRMAMAFAPLSLITGKFTIDHPEVVKKSYPGFWVDAGDVLDIQRGK